MPWHGLSYWHCCAHQLFATACVTYFSHTHVRGRIIICSCFIFTAGLLRFGGRIHNFVFGPVIGRREDDLKDGMTLCSSGGVVREGGKLCTFRTRFLCGVVDY